jgi:hypothetical protein
LGMREIISHQNIAPPSSGTHKGREQAVRGLSFRFSYFLFPIS